MSITTKTGDEGTTSLLGGKRVSKTHFRVEACGTIDELNAALGMARAFATEEDAQTIKQIQASMITLAGDLAQPDVSSMPTSKEVFSYLKPEALKELEKMITEIEGRGIGAKGFSLPGETQFSAAAHLARTICRRAERTVLRIRENGETVAPLVLTYLNRLSDLLWLLARQDEMFAEYD